MHKFSQRHIGVQSTANLQLHNDGKMLKFVFLAVLVSIAESAPTIVGLGHAIAVPTATSHTSRLDIHSSPILYSAPAVVAAPAYTAALSVPAVSHVARVDVTNAGHLGIALGGGLLGGHGIY